jgi:hypothetical protein
MAKTTIQVDQSEIPPEFIQRCIGGEVGGVVLVFLNGKDVVELEKKKNEVIQFAVAMRDKYPAP